jgi:hypothetical protein
MIKKAVVSFLTCSLLLVFALPLPKPAVARGLSPLPPADVLDYLPPSDAIVLVDVHALLNDALPRLFAGDQAKLDQVDAEIAKFKTRTGVDPRSFDRVTVGMRYVYPSPNSTKVETVAIAHGTFDPKALVVASRNAAHGKYREENHRGLIISVININDRIKLAGLWDMRVNELAVCPLDVNTIAIGSPATVRAAVEVGKAGARSNAALAALAGRDPNALIGFGGNVTRALLNNLHVGNDSVAKDAASIRQVFGTVGSTETGFSLLLVARTGTPSEASSLSETIEGLKQLGGLFVTNMQPARKKAAQSALNSLKIAVSGSEVQISTHITAVDLGVFTK